MVVAESGREFCPVCRFEWAAIVPDELPDRMNRAVDEMVMIVSHDPEGARRRIETGRWSSHEYAAHVRDVLLVVRERLILASIEDQPDPAMLHRDERVDLGLYVGESTAETARSLEVARELFLTAHAALAGRFADRTMVYSAAYGGVRTNEWASAQALHECEHHLDDIRENQRRLSA